MPPRFRCLALLGCLFASLCFASDISITGPTEASFGEPVQLRIDGLPEVDLQAPLGEQVEWFDQFTLRLSSPPDSAAVLDEEMAMTVRPFRWRYRLEFTPDEPGAYLLIVSWKDALLVHRIETGSRPDPPTPPPPTPGTLTGAAYLIVVRPEQPTSDQAKDLLDLRTWVDNQAAGRVELLEVTREQESSGGGVDERLSGYIERVPSGEPLPYVFLVRQQTSGGSHIFHEGRVSGNASTWIERAMEVMP